ncbi:unnamed protein product [Citrullus colocynthis]|uniref:Uncharacterized protein n=1 Tax=Citrullus colocynthis TaxID=252529 RepID=A0ABP0Z2G1_9ROSI
MEAMKKSSNDSVKEMAGIVVDKIGVPDIIVNNAGVFNGQGKIWEIPKQEFDNASAYCSSKWAIEGLSISVAKEIPKGMTIMALDPGIVNTDMLFTLLGNIASQFQTPSKWAMKAAPMILNLTRMDNGASLTVDDPGVLPF